MNPDKLEPLASAPPGETETGAGASETVGAVAQAKQTITNTARETALRAKTEVRRFAVESKQEAANRIGGYGSAIRQSAKSLENQDPNIASATHRVADRIQRFADYVREQDFDTLKADAENIARRHPVAFFGGLFVAGLVIGNLLKAHPPRENSDADEDWNPETPAAARR